MSYSNTVRHICTLPTEPQCYDLPPTAGFFRHLLARIRECLLPSQWHHGSTLYIRSNKSMNLERKRQVESGYWFVWHPYSAMKFWWDSFVMVNTFIGLLYMPFQVFYHCSNPYDPYIIFCDAIFFLDVCSKFITGYKDDAFKEVVLEPRKIARNYLQGTFIFDLISALPLHFIVIFPDCTYPTHTATYIFKLFKIFTLRSQFKSFQQQIGLSYINSVVSVIFFRLILFYHWATCLRFQIAMICAHLYKIEGHVLSWMKRCAAYPPNEYTLFHKYSLNLYKVCGLTIGCGHYCPLEEHLIPRMIFASSTGLVGLVFLTHTLCRLLRLVIYEKFTKYVYNGNLQELEQYMAVKYLPKFLQQKICLFINHKFYDQFFNEEAIMSTINDQIKQDINMHCCKRLIMNVPLFHDMPIALINTIIFSLKPLLLMPGQIIMKSGETGSSMYLIYSGTVAVLNSTGREIAHLRDGAYFGVNGILNLGSPRTVSMVALEISEIYKLSHQSFQWCLQPYPHLKRRVAEYGKQDGLDGRPRRTSERRQTTFH